jgi:hypothetical protein
MYEYKNKIKDIKELEELLWNFMMN